MKYEYRMKPNGETIAMKKGECPLDSIYVGEGDDPEPPTFTAQEQYAMLTASINYDKSLHF